MSKTCSDCGSSCKKDEPCNFWEKAEHGDGWCSLCKKVMKWCSECGGYHHYPSGTKHPNIWERYPKLGDSPIPREVIV